MLPRNASSHRAPGRARRLRCGLALVLGAAFAASPCLADIYHLKSGGRVEGELIEETAAGLHIRTALGSMVLRRDQIARIEQTDSVLDQYDARRAELAETADAHAKLAAWCERVDLPRDAKRHYERAIELDPDHAQARAALGFVKLGGMWVEARSTTTQPSDADEQRRAAEREREARRNSARATQGRIALRLRVLHRNLLDTGDDERFARGRAKVLEISDPLAIVPLVETLGDGDRRTRAVMLEALANFPQDEATLNLAAISLLEPDPDLRRFALLELKKRRDPRVIAQYRKALRVDHDEIVRRAASAFVVLQAPTAVPELIDALTVQRRKYVEVPVRQYFGSFSSAFARPGGGVRLGFNGAQTVLEPRVGVQLPGWVEKNVELREVTVFRTEVLEALKAITGENFGFERDAWWRWYRSQAATANSDKE